MIRVLWYGKWHNVDGSHVYMKEVTDRLTKHGLYVGIAYPGEKDLNLKERNPNISYFPLRCLWLNQPYSIFHPISILEFTKIIERFSPDLIHLSFGVGTIDIVLSYLIKSKFPKVKVVTSFHFSFGEHIDRYTIFARGSYIFYAPVGFMVDKVIAFGEGQKKWFEKYWRINPKKIEIIPNGVDLERFSSGGGSTIREKFRGFFLVGYCGRIAPEKNIEKLIKGFLKANLQNSLLLIAGEGILKEGLKKKYSTYNNIIFLGKLRDREEVSDFYRGLDIFVLPSSIEGMSLSLLEALSTKVISLSTPCGEHKYLLPEEQLLDPTDLVESIKTKLRYYYTQARLKGRVKEEREKNTIPKYSWDKTVQSLIKVYNEILLMG